MDLLRKEMERKRRAVELAKKSSSVGRIDRRNQSSSNTRSITTTTTSSPHNPSYLKTADLRRFQERREEEEREKERRAHIHNNRVGRKRRRRDGGEDGCVEEEVSRIGSRAMMGDDTAAVPSVGENDDLGDGEGAGMEDTESAKEARKNDNGSKGQQVRSLKDDGRTDGGDGAVASEEEEEEEEQEQEKPNMTGEDITKSLRELGIPVRLFGETDDSQRMDRLQKALESQKAVLAGMSEMDEFRLGSGHGIRNTFLEGKKGRKDEDLESNRKKLQSKSDVGGDRSMSDRASESILDGSDSKQDADDPHKTIHRFFKLLLRSWENDLAERPDSVKRTAAGRNETKTLKQCKDYIRPLFKLCKTRRLEETIMGRILSIVHFCKEGEFVKANDAYIDVAIGRAAWPIGVTMVGIHARSGRARIESSNVAHVMNSELQRKYLTSVKRLMTYYQKKRVDVHPSKKVTNV